MINAKHLTSLKTRLIVILSLAAGWSTSCTISHIENRMDRKNDQHNRRGGILANASTALNTTNGYGCPEAQQTSNEAATLVPETRSKNLLESGDLKDCAYIPEASWIHTMGTPYFLQEFMLSASDEKKAELLIGFSAASYTRALQYFIELAKEKQIHFNLHATSKSLMRNKRCLIQAPFNRIILDGHADLIQTFINYTPTLLDVPSQIGIDDPLIQAVKRLEKNELKQQTLRVIQAIVESEEFCRVSPERRLKAMQWALAVSYEATTYLLEKGDVMLPNNILITLLGVLQPSSNSPVDNLYKIMDSYKIACLSQYIIKDYKAHKATQKVFQSQFNVLLPQIINIIMGYLPFQRHIIVPPQAITLLESSGNQSHREIARELAIYSQETASKQVKSTIE